MKHPSQQDTGGGPRGHGFARFWKVFMTDSMHLLGAGALATASFLPFALCLLIAVNSHSLLPLVVGGIVGGMLAAPQLCGVADTVLRATREDPNAWWVMYRRAWKRNAKATLLPGAVFGLVFGLQVFIFAQADRVQLDLFLLIFMLVGAALTLAIVSWLLPQMALMDLPFSRALLNSLLLCVRYPLRTLGAALVALAYFGCILLAFPYSLVIFLLLNFWFPQLATTMIFYEPLNDTFHIEESIRAMDSAHGHDR